MANENEELDRICRDGTLSFESKALLLLRFIAEHVVRPKAKEASSDA